MTSIHRDLIGDTELKFVAESASDIDVIFLCLGHGEAKQYLLGNNLNPGVKCIDLSQDFRLGQTVNGRHFIYGLPELNREEIMQAENIANPGCFATAIQLGLLPLATAGLLTEVHTTGITGSTGAGQSLSETSHFSWRSGNIQPYKTLNHQHLNEITRSFLKLGTKDADINFVPWRGDFTRGILVSSTINCSHDLSHILDLYNSFYNHHPFVTLSYNDIALKQVVNTNKCLVHIEKVGGKVVVHTVIDNLLKGASGQAVQNMNLLFGLEETTGLKLKPSAF